jgi:hypothetical protein
MARRQPAVPTIALWWARRVGIAQDRDALAPLPTLRLRALHKFLPAIALGEQQRREIAVVDAHAG